MKKMQAIRSFGLTLCLCSAYTNVSADSPAPEIPAESMAIISQMDRLYETFGSGNDVLPELYKLLEENIRDRSFVGELDSRLRNASNAHNPGVASDPGLLKIMRKLRDAYANDFRVVTGAITYLVLKGDESDLAKISDGISVMCDAVLGARVAGSNLFVKMSVPTEYGGIITNMLPNLVTFRPPFIPSVANTGPQALYVYEILKRAWENAGEDESKIPAELLTMVVWFDEDGNPVCNVDLAKYGLTMPELDVPNRPKPKPKVATASLSRCEEETGLEIRSEELGIETQEAPNRRWFYIIPLMLCAALWVVYKKRNRSSKN